MATLSNKAVEGGAPDARRVPTIDIARGIAVAAMVVYHTAWDLSSLALVDLDVAGGWGWNIFARSIAATFLFLSGISLVLAHRDGLRWRAFWRRLAVLVVAAAGITVATRIAFPHGYIFFGVLHNLALSSLVALPFLRAPPLLAGLAALLVLATPSFVGGGIFEEPALAFLGLAHVPPITYDWVPVFPWTGYVLAGVAVARLLADLLPRADGGRIGRAFATAGRYSLVIYLIHQPLLFGALSGLRQITGPNLVAEAAPFIRHCTSSCQAGGQNETLCRATCDCTVAALRQDGIWNAIRQGNAGGEFLQRAGNRAAECLKRSSR